MHDADTAQGQAPPATDSPTNLPSRSGVAARLMMCVLFFFLIAFGVCTFFTLNTFEKLYIPMAMERYVVASARLRDDLQAYLCGSRTVDELQKCKALRARGNAESLPVRIARFQKDILAIESRHHGVSHEDGAHISDIAVAVASASKGTIYFSSGNVRLGRKLPDATQYKRISDIVSHDEDGGRYVVSMPLYDVDNEKLAVLSVSFDESIVLSITGSLLKGHHEPLKFLLAGCVIALLLSILLSLPKTLTAETMPRKKVISTVLLLLLLTQLGSASMGIEELNRVQAGINLQKTQDMVDWVKDDIEEQLGYGMNLTNAIRMLRSRRSAGVAGDEAGDLTQVYSIQALDTPGVIRLVHTHQAYLPYTGEATDSRLDPDDANWVVVPIKRDGEVIGQLGTELPSSALGGHIISVGVDALIALVISILCVVELLILSFKYIETVFKRAEEAGRDPAVPPARGIGSIHYSYMRPAIFLFLFGVDFSAVLIPLQMENLYEPMLGLPKDFIIALPVTAMFASVGITFLIAGAWMDRRGWNEPFITGVVITGICKLYAWMAPDAAHFIVAMSGVGFGYGLALMAAQGFVMASTHDQEKAHGIAYFFAGVYAGNIGGLAVGAMVAEHIDYEHIFLIGSMFIFASLAFSLKFLRPAFLSPDMIDPNESGVEFKAANFWSFITDRNVVSLVLLCSVPAAVAMIGFLHYFTPVYLDRSGVPESLIGGVLMLYGVSLVYISPLVSRLIDATDRKDLFIALGCVLGAIGFMSFGFLEGIAAAVTAVFFLGLSGSCLQSSQTAYTLTLKATQQLGPGKGVAYVRATSRLGQMLGPTVFSWFVIASDTEYAVMNFGLVYFAIALMFILFSKREKRPVVVKAPEAEPVTAEAKAG